MLSFLQGQIMVSVAADITYRFRQQISEKINRLPLRFFDTMTQGEFAQPGDQRCGHHQHHLNQSLSQMVTSWLGGRYFGDDVHHQRHHDAHRP